MNILRVVVASLVCETARHPLGYAKTAEVEGDSAVLHIEASSSTTIRKWPAK